MVTKKIRNMVLLNQEEALKELNRLGADKRGALLMAPKAIHRVLKIYDLESRQANLLKQEMLSKGGEAAVEKGVVDFSISKSNVILMATLKQYEAVIQKLKMQPFGMVELSKQIKETLLNLEGRSPKILDCRGKSLTIGKKTLVMGILNTTPDSFSDGGKFNDMERALEHALEMVENGADIIDLGGESTRPGHIPVDSKTEKERLLPVLKRLVQKIKVPISVDTFKGDVAEAVLDEGANIINDQWALNYDSKIASIVARYKAPIILMHNQKGNQYQDMLGDMISYFNESIQKGLEAGIEKHNMIIDPGIGFGKDLAQNLEVMHRLEELNCVGLPVLLATSRKGMIGKTLDLSVDQRVEGTIATVVLGITKGVDMVRVHDVKEVARAVKMTDAMVRFDSQGDEING